MGKSEAGGGCRYQSLNLLHTEVLVVTINHRAPTTVEALSFNAIIDVLICAIRLDNR